jgi:hypothetical protein
MKMATQMTLEVTDTTPIWAVYVNTDLTEGRGYQYPLYLCETKTTAQRMAKGKNVMGSDGDVIEVLAYHVRDVGLLVPGSMTQIIPPSAEDRAAEAAQQAKIRKIAACERARELGLSEQDIEALLRPV